MNAWQPRLIVITDTSVAPLPVLELRIECLVRAALPRTIAIQLRDRGLSIRTRLFLARRLRNSTRRFDQMLIVNDRMDLCTLTQADGIHLAEESVTVEDSRQILGPDAWISCACHDPMADEPHGADGLLLSPIMAPRKGRPALGFKALEVARQRAPHARIYALGGIHAENAGECIAAGADCVASVKAALGPDTMGPLLKAVGAYAG